MPPHKRGIWIESVDTPYTFLIPNAKYPALHEECVTFELVTNCYIGL